MRWLWVQEDGWRERLIHVPRELPATNDNLLPDWRKVQSATRRQQWQWKAQPVSEVPQQQENSTEASQQLRCGSLLHAIDKSAPCFSGVPANPTRCTKALGSWMHPAQHFIHSYSQSKVIQSQVKKKSARSQTVCRGKEKISPAPAGHLWERKHHTNVK